MSTNAQSQLLPRETERRPAQARRGSLAISRRTFLKATGVLIVSFSLLDTKRLLAAPPAVPGRQGVPAERLDSWLAIAEDGSVTLFTGKVELGTGVETALAQIAAEELDVPFASVTVVQGDTALTVDQGATVGSLTISRGGAEIRRAAAEARQVLLQLAAEHLGVPVEQLVVRDGVVSVAGDPARQVSYGALVGGRRLEVELTGTAQPKSPAQYTIVGQSIPRVDIPGKVTGQFQYVQDVRVPGMLHGRVVRPPAQSGATLVSVDETSVSDVPGLVQVVVRGNFVGVVAEREEQAIRAARQLRVAWSDPAGLPPAEDLYALVRRLPSDDRLLDAAGDVEAALSQAAQVLTATYEYPPQMHGMMGPSCAVADVREGRATVWSGSQYPHRLQTLLAQWLGLPAENVRVIYVEGSGCYGRYTTDDAALDAALLSQAVGRPVRVQWMREDEHGWDHYNPPMVFDLRGGLDARGNLIAWDYAVWSAMHRGQALLGDRTGGPWTIPLDPYVGEHTQHVVYDFANRRYVLHALESGPLRYGNNRSLGGLPSAFASESFMDELAAAAGVDPVQFRLRYLTDPRASEVLKAAAERLGWETRPSPRQRARGAGTVTGRGIALAEYGVFGGQFGRTWVATAAEVEVDQESGEVRVGRIVVAHDCGLIINPDGVRGQVEGNVLHSLSRTLHEEVTFDQASVTSLDWSTYPILTFAEVPEVEVVLINRPDLAPAGVGEPATVPTAAAVGNAIFDATGVRLRRVPFTPARVLAALRQLS
ncbi:MAG TPA: molybdopterin cofactor-binding domain-containing protein [Chloroflexota bacterium]|nr:molybdopterin cofactor-binding domain-containing protein [Chloroflexota bacterium]